MRDQARAGKRGVVYDPRRSAGWPADWPKYQRPENFLAALPRMSECYVVIDEAKTLWELDPRTADNLVLQGRHDGFAVIILAQRTRHVPPNARNQCPYIYAFRQQLDDADTLASEYHRDLSGCTELGQGEFIASDGFRIGHYRLDFSDGTPPIVAPL